jgi:hypothetical protein
MWAIYEYQLTRQHEPVLEFYHRNFQESFLVTENKLYLTQEDSVLKKKKRPNILQIRSSLTK